MPTVTTNLAGFGQWVLDNRGGNAKKSGVRVITRTDSNYSDAVDAIAGSMMNVYMMADTEMRRIRTHARGTGRLASWTHFMDSYTVAYLQALACAKSRTESMITHDYDSYL